MSEVWITPRTAGEREAYLQGYEAGIRAVEELGDIERARRVASVIRDALEEDAAA